MFEDMEELVWVKSILEFIFGLYRVKETILFPFDLLSLKFIIDKKKMCMVKSQNLCSRIINSIRL